MTSKLKCTIAVSVLLAAMPSFAFAQQQSGEIDEIIVTAQKREQSFQDVPVSLVAISGEVLKTRNIDSFEQLQYVAPGLSFSAGVNSRQSASTIRGIGTSLFNTGVEGSVAIVIDGVVAGREGAGIFDFSDVERVEVLRGPQGTLFGKNASAGVISIVTKKPTDEFSANLSASYGSFDEVNLSGGISGPIANGVTGRISGYFNERDGYINNVNPAAMQTTLNNKHEFGIRGKLAFDVSDTVDIMLGADYSKRDQNSGAFTLRSPSSGGAGAGLLGFGPAIIGGVSAGLGIVAGPDNYDIGSDQLFTEESEIYGGYAETNIDLGYFDLVSLTSYREWNSLDNNDADLINLPFLSQNSGDLQQDQFSQEFRLISPGGERLTYSLGAFYFTQNIDQNSIQAGTAGLNLLGALPNGLTLGTDLKANFQETNMAAFGQGEYKLTDKLLLLGGLRLLRSDISTTQARTVAAGSVGPFAGQNITAAPLVGDVEDTAVVWRAGLQYFLNDNVNVFGTVSKGYKSAGLVTGLTANATTIGGTELPIVNPEIPLQFELGVRSKSSDGRITANLTGFFMEISDFQAQALVPGPSGLPSFSVTNAGVAETYGIEGDITFVPVDALTLSTSFAYTHARFSEFDKAPCYALQPIGPGQCISAAVGANYQDLEGGRLAQSPDLILNGLTRYDFSTVGSVTPFAQVGVQYRSDAISSNTNDPATKLDSRFLLDAQLGFSFMDDRASLMVFGRNLTDEKFVEAIVGASFDTGGYAQFRTFESERTIGVKFDWTY